MTDQDLDNGADRAPTVPTPVRVASILQQVEGVCVVGAGLLWLVLSLTDRPDDLGASLIGAILAVLGGIVLVRLGIGVGRGQQWARSPVVAVQFLLLPVGFAMTFQGGVLQYGVPVLAVAVALIVLLFTRPAHAVFDREYRGSGET